MHSSDIVSGAFLSTSTVVCHTILTLSGAYPCVYASMINILKCLTTKKKKINVVTVNNIVIVHASNEIQQIAWFLISIGEIDSIVYDDLSRYAHNYCKMHVYPIRTALASTTGYTCTKIVPQNILHRWGISSCSKTDNSALSVMLTLTAKRWPFMHICA